MQPQEILPEPETTGYKDILETSEGSGETSSVLQTERKQSSAQGSTALSAIAVDDAQGLVQQSQSQISSDIGAAASSTGVVMVPDSADDLDLIEKAWVQKAKQIVDSTQGDPYVQNTQLNKMKVEYIKKRYDKDIKHSEEQ